MKNVRVLDWGEIDNSNPAAWKAIECKYGAEKIEQEWRLEEKLREIEETRIGTKYADGGYDVEYLFKDKDIVYYSHVQQRYVLQKEA